MRQASDSGENRALNGLNNHHGPDSACGADRNEGELSVQLFQAVGSLEDHPGSRRAEWVTERDRSAVRIHLRHVDRADFRTEIV